jgi:hypothetical protein
VGSKREEEAVTYKLWNWRTSQPLQLIGSSHSFDHRITFLDKRRSHEVFSYQTREQDLTPAYDVLWQILISHINSLPQFAFFVT